jgi:hypothetical protein
VKADTNAEPSTRRMVGVIQSSYLPWKGFFDVVASVDEFVLLDDVQFTRRDWRNRNRIKGVDGTGWITIPVQAKGRFDQLVQDVRIADPRWNSKHWRAIHHTYASAPYFQDYRESFEELLLGSNDEFLSPLNRRCIEWVCRALGINTRITWSSELDTRPDRNERLIDICQALDATTYLSGPTASGYVDTMLFESEGIDVVYMDYSYPEYPQLGSGFEHQVSIIDVLFNAGPEAPQLARSKRRPTGNPGGNHNESHRGLP